MLKHGLRNRREAVLPFVRAPPSAVGASLNLWAYIDGFNLYNGALKGTAYKWLDLQAFTQTFRAADQVSVVKFFTARVNARPNDRDLCRRSLTPIGSQRCNERELTPPE